MMSLVHTTSLKKSVCRRRTLIIAFAIAFLFLGTIALEAALFSGLSHPAWEAKKAAEALSAGRLEEAEAALLRARQREPDLPELSYNLGIVKYRKRQYEQAADEFDRASATSDRLLKAAALYNQGNCYFRLQQWEQAIKSYSDSLSIHEDQKTRFNLEQAQKKLREQMQRLQNQQTQSSRDQPKSQPRQEQQHQQQNQFKSHNDQQEQNEPNRQSGSGSPERRIDQQHNTQNQQASDGQMNDDQQQSASDRDQQQNASGTPQTPDIDQLQNQASATPSVTPTENGTDSRNVAQPPNHPQINSDAASIPESLASGPVTSDDVQQNIRDLQMRSDTTPLVRDASDRAKQLKNVQLNPYLVDRILKQMEEREKEVQRRLRRDPNREENLEDMDPFFMSPDQLRNFFERRRNPQPRRSIPEQPDW